MRVTGKKLLGIVPHAADHVTIGAAIAITRKRYCARVHAAGYCSNVCEDCGSRLQAIFARLESAREPQRPAGLLTWLARDEAVKYIEAQRSTEKQAVQKPKVELFETPERNPFLAILE